MRDEFYVDYVNSDSHAMTEAALDLAEAHEAFRARMSTVAGIPANDDDDEVADAA